SVQNLNQLAAKPAALCGASWGEAWIEAHSVPWPNQAGSRWADVPGMAVAIGTMLSIISIQDSFSLSAPFWRRFCHLMPRPPPRLWLGTQTPAHLSPVIDYIRVATPASTPKRSTSATPPLHRFRI